jgi:hypothetical protein
MKHHLDLHALNVDTFAPTPAPFDGSDAHEANIWNRDPSDSTGGGSIDTGPFMCSSLPSTSYYYPC